MLGALLPCSGDLHCVGLLKCREGSCHAEGESRKSRSLLKRVEGSGGLTAWEDPAIPGLFCHSGKGLSCSGVPQEGGGDDAPRLEGALAAPGGAVPCRGAPGRCGGRAGVAAGRPRRAGGAGGGAAAAAL